MKINQLLLCAVILTSSGTMLPFSFPLRNTGPKDVYVYFYATGCDSKKTDPVKIPANGKPVNVVFSNNMKDYCPTGSPPLDRNSYIYMQIQGQEGKKYPIVAAASDFRNNLFLTLDKGYTGGRQANEPIPNVYTIDQNQNFLYAKYIPSAVTDDARTVSIAKSMNINVPIGNGSIR